MNERRMPEKPTRHTDRIPSDSKFFAIGLPLILAGLGIVMLILIGLALGVLVGIFPTR